VEDYRYETTKKICNDNNEIWRKKITKGLLQWEKKLNIVSEINSLFLPGLKIFTNSSRSVLNKHKRHFILIFQCNLKKNLKYLGYV
jgi:hypothetical protein